MLRDTGIRSLVQGKSWVAQGLQISQCRVLTAFIDSFHNHLFIISSSAMCLFEQAAHNVKFITAILFLLLTCPFDGGDTH